MDKNKLLELAKELDGVVGHLLYGDRNVSDIVEDSIERLVYIIQKMIFAIVDTGEDDDTIS